MVPNTNGLRGVKAAIAIGVVAGDSDKHLLCISQVKPNKYNDIKNITVNDKLITNSFELIDHKLYSMYNSIEGFMPYYPEFRTIDVTYVNNEPYT